jgi:DNA primase
LTLTPAFLDELRARTPLSALIAKTVKLTRAGREMKGCCPFHNEKTPSFYVNDDKGFYHCFGCSAHGDAIRWMTDQRGLPFMDAVKELAAAAGMEVPVPSPRDAERAERQKTLTDAMEAAAEWFRQQLGGLDGTEARALLERRGVSEATAKAFGFGFAPDARGRLRTALKAFGDDMLVEAGLLISVEGKEPYDRFRGRLMIPIRDARGRTIAFGGRVIGDGEPKYLNSPDTPLFDKGRTLFNLDKALAPARKADRVIVVEGYMDAVALAQAGIGEVVAPLGTALTEAQLERLWRIGDVPLVCLDGDSAGQKAAIRAATRALPMLAPGRSLAFVTLPDGQDPDDLIRKQGVAAFERCAMAAEPLVERLWKHELTAEPLDTPERRAGLKQRLNALADTIADASVKAEYRADFRHRFDEQFARNRQPPAQRTPFYPYAQRRRGEKWAPPPAPVTDDAKKVRAAGGIDPILAKAVVAGLIRHPAEIARHIEVLGSLRFVDGALGRLFEAVVDLALDDRGRDGSLDSGKLVTILSKTGFSEVASELLRADTMPYSFTRKAGDERRAREDLDEAIAILVAKPEVDAGLAEATAAMQASFTDAAFARQVALVNEQRALETRLANLVQATEDARALGTEDD